MKLNEIIQITEDKTPDDIPDPENLTVVSNDGDDTDSENTTSEYENSPIDLLETQKKILITAFSSGRSVDYEVIISSFPDVDKMNLNQSKNSLEDLGLISIDNNIVTITDYGIESLKRYKYIDNSDQLIPQNIKKYLPTASD